MPDWRTVWRNGLSPLLSRESLECLRVALANDDSRLCQRSLCLPPMLSGLEEWPLEGGCPLVFPAWQEGQVKTVGDASRHFASLCEDADMRLGQLGACSAFWCWYDESSRRDAFRELLAEVTLALEGKAVVNA
jgi:hypothetical protein